jgi:hypothetical protein
VLLRFGADAVTLRDLIGAICIVTFYLTKDQGTTANIMGNWEIHGSKTARSRDPVQFAAAAGKSTSGALVPSDEPSSPEATKRKHPARLHLEKPA